MNLLMVSRHVKVTQLIEQLSVQVTLTENFLFS